MNTSTNNTNGSNRSNANGHEVVSLIQNPGAGKSNKAASSERFGRTWLIPVLGVAVLVFVFFVSVQERVEDTTGEAAVSGTTHKNASLSSSSSSVLNQNHSALPSTPTTIATTNDHDTVATGDRSVPASSSPPPPPPPPPPPMIRIPSTSAPLPGATTTNDDTTNTNTVRSIPTTEDLESLSLRFALARQAMMEDLYPKYGRDNFDVMFQVSKPHFAKYFFQSPTGDQGPSWERIQRRFIIKLLQAQQKQKQQAAAAEALSSSSNPTPVTFVWATGGHSASAGHGNFYDESYTAYMERAAQPVFAATGIHFVGRNYAMGGTASAPEIAWCIDEIFGLDIDVLSWDFGMTDGNGRSKIELYCRRAGLNPDRPACMGFHIGGRTNKGRIDALGNVEADGMAAMYADDEVLGVLTDRVPDSLGLSDAQIQAMPAFVRNFRCGKLLESGEPYCSKEKFNSTMCNERRFRTSWHPGWKWHAAMGHVLALFLVEMLDQAIQSIASSNTDEATLLADALAGEQADAEKFELSPLPEQVSQIFDDEDGPSDLDPTILYKAPNFCHTARVPAEIRHMGILTETDQVGFDTYDMGISKREADQNPNESDKMRLIFDADMRQQCPVHLNMDAKDYFYVNSNDGWKGLTLPNDRELEYYGHGQTLKGLVVICPAVCDWGNCPKGNLMGPDIATGELQMEVNGVPVVSATKLSMNTCQFLKHANGHYFTPNAQGRLVVRAKSNPEKSYVRFGSIVVF